MRQEPFSLSRAWRSVRQSKVYIPAQNDFGIVAHPSVQRGGNRPNARNGRNPQRQTGQENAKSHHTTAQLAPC
jgi:hypothetical protein